METLFFPKSPLVSIVIPVYNGEEHLASCLESIAAQTFLDWTAIIVNNCSTDRTEAIAQGFARRDPRFRVETCTEFLPQVGNYNRAVSQASPDAKFIKIVEADNVLWPECVERQVAIASEDEKIGLVGCCYLFGESLQGAGFPVFLRIEDGRKVAIAHLREDCYLLGTPTTLLFRAEALRALNPAFRPDMLHDDVDLAIRILMQWKFGFDHRILAFIRIDNGGLISKYVYLDFKNAQGYYQLLSHGMDAFDQDEFRRLTRLAKVRYYRSMGRGLLNFKGREYWEFHAAALRRAGDRLKWYFVLLAALAEVFELLLNPLSTLRRICNRFRRKSSMTLYTSQGAVGAPESFLEIATKKELS